MNLEFDVYKQKLGEVKPALDGLADSLNLEGLRNELERFQAMQEAPGFWDDPEKSQKIVVKVKHAEAKIERYEKMTATWDDLITICEMAEEEDDDSMLPELKEGFETLTEEDTVVLCGDLSWGMSLEEAKEDFAYLNALPGKKLLMKGNHDYWWTTASKMKKFFEENGFDTFDILHNNCHFYGDVALCGTRGWFYEIDRGEHSAKIFNRELMRLEASLKAAGEREKFCFLHYPPLYQG